MSAAALTAELTEHVKRRAADGGVHLDTYDADYILGLQMEWLRNHDAALTSRGVKRFKRPNKARETA